MFLRAEELDMTGARSAYRSLVWLLVLGLGAQSFLAGLGVGVMAARASSGQRRLGSVLQIVSLLLLQLAAIGKMSRQTIGMSVGLVVMMGLQSPQASEKLDGMGIRAKLSAK